jgi:beta-lactamase class A
VSSRMKYLAAAAVVVLVSAIVLAATLSTGRGANPSAAHAPASPTLTVPTLAPTAAPTLPSAVVTPPAAPGQSTPAPVDNTAASQEAVDPEPSDHIAVDALGQPVHLDLAGFEATVSELLGGVDGLLEIVVALPDGTTLFEFNSTEQMESASLYKLAVMIEIYRQREAGLLTLDDTILMIPDYFTEDDEVFGPGDIGTVVSLSSLLVYAIDYSSNVAASALLARAGTDNVNATMAELGLSCTEIRWTPGIWVGIDSFNPPPPPGPDDSDGVDEPANPDPFAEPEQPEADEPNSGDRPVTLGDAPRALLAAGSDRTPVGRPRNDERADAAMNVTCAADVASIYVDLLNGELVSPAASEDMLELLKGQLIDDRIPAYLPEGTVTAHKTGNWEGLVHDAGVVWAPLGPVVVSVMTDIGDEGRAVEIIATIALAAYAFNS